LKPRSEEEDGPVTHLADSRRRGARGKKKRAITHRISLSFVGSNGRNDHTRWWAYSSRESEVRLLFASGGRGDQLANSDLTLSEGKKGEELESRVKRKRKDLKATVTRETTGGQRCREKGGGGERNRLFHECCQKKKKETKGFAYKHNHLVATFSPALPRRGGGGGGGTGSILIVDSVPAAGKRGEEEGKGIQLQCLGENGKRVLEKRGRKAVLFKREEEERGGGRTFPSRDQDLGPSAWAHQFRRVRLGRGRGGGCC